MKEYSRAELLALTPARYLADGFFDGEGKPRRELRAEYATAAATQFKAAELAPQELAFTNEALKQTLEMQDDRSANGFKDSLTEALATVEHMIQQPNNRGLVTWLQECAAAVKRPADIDALLAHLLAVLRQYTVIAAAP
jgi:hypothetical protein